MDLFQTMNCCVNGPVDSVLSALYFFIVLFILILFIVLIIDDIVKYIKNKNDKYIGSLFKSIFKKILIAVGIIFVVATIVVVFSAFKDGYDSGDGNGSVRWNKCWCIDDRPFGEKLKDLSIFSLIFMFISCILPTIFIFIGSLKINHNKEEAKIDEKAKKKYQLGLWFVGISVLVMIIGLPILLMILGD